MKRAKPQEAPKGVQGADVGVINHVKFTRLLLCFLTFLANFLVQTASAATLPEERTDVLFHSYDGGGIEITGPSVLVRKNIKEKVSVYGNYYVDQITSASIDVITSGASEYEEERTEYSVGAEYLYDKSTISLSTTQSSENDYEASTVSFDLSQEFFGDMTTFSLGFSQGEDVVRKTGDPEFERDATHRRYRVSLNQILSPKWMMGISLEAVSDAGFLNNPYRSIRHFNGDGSNAVMKPERYPETRNSDAAAVRTIYRLPYRASIRGEVRTFSDNWGIKASNAELRYLHAYENDWTFQANIRTYSQTQADFYSDIFSYNDSEQEFVARDKEMSEFDSMTFGLGVYYDVPKKWLSFIDKTTISFQFDHMQFDYKNFRDASQSMGDSAEFRPGEEPLYELKANVIRFYISVYY